MPRGQVRRLMTTYHDLDLGPREEWDEKEAEMAAIFRDFLKRAVAPPRPPSV